MSRHAATLLLTPGDPGGLGPELVIRLFSQESQLVPGRVVLVGHMEALRLHQKDMGLQGDIFSPLDSLDGIAGLPPGVYGFTPQDIADLPATPGEASRDGGRAAGVSLQVALEQLNQGKAHGLVTGPLNKAKLMEAGYDFPGHTEFLAEGAGLKRDEVCMHLCGPSLRVSLVTTHLPISRVPAEITRERILRCLGLTCRFLEELGVDGPVAVAGLNPHAGEEGRLGREEIEIIQPAVEQALRDGLQAVGPLPGDTVFHRAARGEFGAVLAMFHDQGLAPLKSLHFSDAVNVTLGLPFVRTSVDHGAGYDLVGTGRASISSLRSAVTLASQLVSAV
ncbi:MAG: 4-hydroxythreonine-4-phosphate dehydrogenase PdxA [Desulfovibrionaceae bacterium]